MPSQPLWNRSCDWIDHWTGGWSLFADYEPRTMYHDYIKLRNQQHTDHPNDYPWSSRKRLVGVLTVCAIALSWVLAAPASVLGLLYGNWVIRCIAGCCLSVLVVVVVLQRRHSLGCFVVAE